MGKIRVLVVDDSALMRRMLNEILNGDPGIEVVGQAPDPFIARELIKQLNPDVLTLDVEMPRMDGLTFLSNLMRLRPTPVVMVSSLTERGAPVTLEALSLGAFDFVEKPKVDLKHGLESVAAQIVAKVKAAAAASHRIRNRVTRPAGEAPKIPVAAPLGFRTTDRLIAIGASTGGTEAIREVLELFPPDAPGTVITQHIPAAFSAAFAERLDRTCALRVFHAEDGMRILPGHGYVAPGGKQMKVQRHGAHWICKVTDDPPVNQHRPSVDVLFESVVVACGVNAAGVLMTGMGADGAAGLKKMKDAGCWTVAQDEATSVVWGMPGAAVKLGAACAVVPLDRIAGTVLRSTPLAA